MYSRLSMRRASRNRLHTHSLYAIQTIDGSIQLLWYGQSPYDGQELLLYKIQQNEHGDSVTRKCFKTDEYY